jgi:type I restriction enzyme S subunit
LIVTLAQAMDAIIDYRGKTPTKTPFGIPLITAKIVKDGRITEPDEFIAEVEYDAWMRRGIPKPGDVVLTTEAPLGEVARLDNRRVALAQRLICLRGKAGLLDNGYLKYLLMSKPIQAQLRSRESGSTVSGIKQSELRKLIFDLPPFESQIAIASILGALDDKIELNRQMNQTLEAIAQALFRSWFVDFDPVRAKLEGRKPEGIDAETAALFPSEFEESELRMFPKGWSVGRLGDIAATVGSQIKPSEMDADMPYIGLEHMPRKSIALDNWGRADGLESNKFQFRTGQILFGKLRPYFHKVGVAPVDGVCSTDIFVLQPKAPHYFALLLGHVSSEDFIAFTDTGEGTRMPRTNWSRMGSYPIVLPPRCICSIATEILSPLISRIIANIHESRTLAEIRDALLPKLITGEVPVELSNTTKCDSAVEPAPEQTPVPVH